MTIAYIEYPTLEEAPARDAEFWAAVRGPGWKPGDVTQYVYGRRVRTGDPEADAGLPAEGDYFITIHAADDDLNTLITADVIAPREAGACAPLYPVGRGRGVCRRCAGQLCRCTLSLPTSAYITERLDTTGGASAVDGVPSERRPVVRVGGQRAGASRDAAHLRRRGVRMPASARHTDRMGAAERPGAVGRGSRSV